MWDTRIGIRGLMKIDPSGPLHCLVFADKDAEEGKKAKDKGRRAQIDMRHVSCKCSGGWREASS